MAEIGRENIKTSRAPRSVGLAYEVVRTFEKIMIGASQRHYNGLLALVR